MTWLFVRFYLCVLVVLFVAWWIYGAVLKQRTDADLARVIVEAHGGGARLAAHELDATPPESREQVLNLLRRRFDYPVDMIALTYLPSSLQRQIHGGEDVACFRLGEGHCVVAALSNGSGLVRLGPFPDYDGAEIEQAIGGWMRLTADKLDAAGSDERQAVLQELQKGFDFPVEIVSRKDLPAWPQGRIARGEDIVFYPQEPQPDDRWLAATPLSDGTSVVRFGPFPSFERVEQKAATTTLALVLPPATEELDELVGELLRYVRLETTQPTLDVEQIALRDALGVLIPKHAALHPTVQFDVDESVRDEQVIAAERAGLHRALGNVLSNAGQFARSRVRISATSTDRATIVDIDDDGEGIPAAERERVFEPFVRLQDNSPERGVGLGLALVKRIPTPGMTGRGEKGREQTLQAVIAPRTWEQIDAMQAVQVSVLGDLQRRDLALAEPHGDQEHSPRRILPVRVDGVQCFRVDPGRGAGLRFVAQAEDHRVAVLQGLADGELPILARQDLLVPPHLSPAAKRSSRSLATSLALSRQ